MYKRLVRAVAKRHGMEATFMAKPYAGETGSGTHLHISLADGDGGNRFAAEGGDDLLRHAIGGMGATIRDGMLVFAPNANSYRRFQTLSYAPLAPTWGVNNRTVALRVPIGPPAAKHVEHRVAGADANPYLALAAALAGMHRGILDQRDPGPPVTGNGYGTPASDIPPNWLDLDPRLPRVRPDARLSRRRLRRRLREDQAGRIPPLPRPDPAARLRLVRPGGVRERAEASPLLQSCFRHATARPRSGWSDSKRAVPRPALSANSAAAERGSSEPGRQTHIM